MVYAGVVQVHRRVGARAGCWSVSVYFESLNESLSQHSRVAVISHLRLLAPVELVLVRRRRLARVQNPRLDGARRGWQQGAQLTGRHSQLSWSAAGGGAGGRCVWRDVIECALAQRGVPSECASASLRATLC